MPAGRDNILFTSVLSFIGGEQEDLFDVTRVQWDEKGLNMKTQPEPLFMVIHGTVKDIANGRTLQSTITAPEKCRELGVFVLKASEYPKLKPNGFVVAQPTPSESESPKLLNQAKSCGAPPDSYVKRAR
ncbi:MAG: hypothetical protein A2289_07230 [Deltaproteobacteria bacterium RIFOXYA12_FULL_58_15]|nr:MAG: hypothetical protein A2289_07230 [Deltaproteobacteria bacterium RIFOXYA12_FULL_58_15]